MFYSAQKNENSSQQPIDLFLTKLEVILNSQHQLFQLAKWINWNWLETKLGAAYVEEIGRPGLPTPLDGWTSLFAVHA